jgi:hypothetical protein
MVRPSSTGILSLSRNVLLFAWVLSGSSAGSLRFLLGSCGKKGTDSCPHVCQTTVTEVGIGEAGYGDIKAAFESDVQAHCTVLAAAA